MTNGETAACDLLVISPHTDDAEIGLGGTICQLVNQGRKVWAVDLTRGELGTNATPDERWVEAEKASAVLGLTGRAQLDLPDGFIDGSNRSQIETVVAVIRRLRPRWIVTAPDPVRHPDHQATPDLVGRAAFLARLAALQPNEAPDLGALLGDDERLPAVLLRRIAMENRPLESVDSVVNRLKVGAVDRRIERERRALETFDRAAAVENLART